MFQPQQPQQDQPKQQQEQQQQQQRRRRQQQNSSSTTTTAATATATTSTTATCTPAQAQPRTTPSGKLGMEGLRVDVEWVKITWEVVTLRCLCPPLTLWRSWNATRDMVGNVGMGPSGMGIIHFDIF